MSAAPSPAGRVRRGARRLHRLLNALLIAGLACQFYTAGLAAFGRPFTAHALLGWSLIATALVLSVAALVGHGLAGPARLSLLLLVLLVLQPVFVFVLAHVSVEVAALHPVNGLAALVVSVLLERRLRALVAGSAAS